MSASAVVPAARLPVLPKTPTGSADGVAGGHLAAREDHGRQRGAQPRPLCPQVARHRALQPDPRVLLTHHGVELADVYVGPQGVLTGSARQAQEALERTDATARVQDLEVRRTNLERVLQWVADGLLTILRPMDTVARLGGDEFVVLAPGVDSRAHALEMGKRVTGELARWLNQDDAPGPITASVGVSVSVAGRGSAEVLLGEADRAMYTAKSRGGAAVQVFDAALGREVETRTAAEQRIHSALDERRIAVRYQPIVDLGANLVAGFEALARILDRDGTLLSPEAFIPVAEASGMVVQLGAQVLESACVEAEDWQAVAAPERPVSLAVNLSPRQFDSGNLMATVSATLDRTGLDPELLHLEITETAIIDLSPVLLSQLGQLRDIGVQIGLDDFGTGYASLTHLRRLPLTFVKVDRSFVGGLVDNHEDERIVSAVIDLAANLGLRSIAEGVETPRQLDRLRELGCDQAQGYLFAKPVPAKDVSDAIRNLDVLELGRR